MQQNKPNTRKTDLVDVNLHPPTPLTLYEILKHIICHYIANLYNHQIMGFKTVICVVVFCTIYTCTLKLYRISIAPLSETLHYFRVNRL